MSDWIPDFRVDILISDWISADSVRDFFRDGALVRNIQMMYNTHTYNKIQLTSVGQV